MSSQPKNNLIKKFLYLTGIASASVCLNLPVLAVTNPNLSTLNLSSSNQTLRGDSHPTNRELLAQSRPPSNQIPPEGSDDTMYPTSPGGGSSTTPEGSTRGSSSTTPPNPTGGNNRIPAPSSTPTDVTPSTDQPTSSSSGIRLERGTWLCLNNPNPQCSS